MKIENKVMIFYNKMKKDTNHRFLSWEYCYEYFLQDIKLIDEDTASLHLGFYLASWGMYRGSGSLIWKDYKIHKNIIKIILNPKYKTLQNTKFNDEDIIKIFELRDDIRKQYKKDITIVDGNKKNFYATDTLVTKIILGTLGCVPAYDRFVKQGMYDTNIKPNTFKIKNFKKLLEFYNNNKKEFDKISNDINYPIMKVMDMFFFELGNK